MLDVLSLEDRRRRNRPQGRYPNTRPGQVGRLKSPALRLFLLPRACRPWLPSAVRVQKSQPLVAGGWWRSTVYGRCHGPVARCFPADYPVGQRTSKPRSSCGAVAAVQASWGTFAYEPQTDSGETASRVVCSRVNRSESWALRTVGPGRNCCWPDNPLPRPARR